MAVPFNDLHRQYLSLKSELDTAIETTIRNSAFIRGPEVDLFEQEFAKLMKAEHCVSCANGTDALYIAMKSLHLQPSDEVIVPAVSWISTSETVTQAGGTVVFCDINRDSYTINPDDIRQKITPNTVGIIPVHLYGCPADMNEILTIAKEHNLWVIEDCAQSHLADIGSKQVGTFGDIATFSFYPGKNLGAMGDAGALITNDNNIASFSKKFARHGGLVKGDHEIEGINSRLDGLQAAILNVKLPHLQKWTKKRQEIAVNYAQTLQDVGDITLPIVPDGYGHVYHLFVIRTSHRDALRAHLSEAGIASVINYPISLPFLPAYSYLHHSHDDFPVAFAYQSQILSLPIFPEMTEDEVAFVCNTIKAFFATRQ